MKLQKDQSKIKSRINYRYYIDVFINIAVYSIIFYVSKMNKIKAEITITDEQIDNWLCGSFEGGSNYWCKGIKVKNNDYKGTKYASECVSKGGIIIVDDENCISNVDKNRILITLQVMSSEYPKSFDRLINDSYDSDDSDRLFQIACFGEVIYG